VQGRSSIVVRPISRSREKGAIGLERSKKLTRRMFERVNEAWKERQVIVMRAAKISVEGQLDGTIEKVVGSIGALPVGRSVFSSERCYDETLRRAPLQDTLQLHSTGDKPLLACTNRAHQTLPGAPKRLHSGVRLGNLHDYDACSDKRTFASSLDASIDAIPW
jgi:hypothetical protein